MVKEWIADIVPQDHVPGERKEIIYEGPVTFRCRGQHVGDLFNRFGPPSGLVEKDVRCRTIYTIQQATITSEDLYWLSQISDCNIRIHGPEPLVDSVRNYYAKTIEKLLNPILPANKKQVNNNPVTK